MSPSLRGIMWMKQWFNPSVSFEKDETLTVEDVQSKYFSRLFVKNFTLKPRSKISAGSKSCNLSAYLLGINNTSNYFWNKIYAQEAI